MYNNLLPNYRNLWPNCDHVHGHKSTCGAIGW